MSTNVETMMYTREKPWHGLGTMVEEAPTSLDAIKLAGLNWRVEPQRITLMGDDRPIENVVANVRDSDGKVLGLVTDRYKIVQNADAFGFTDTLIGGDVRYETAGALNGGKKIWLLAKMPTAKVAGDDVEPYLCFTNTHDGTGAVRVAMTPVRVVCNNTLNFALSTAKRAWSVVHTGDINRKIVEAQECLELANRYMIGLDRYAERLIDVKVDMDTLNKVLGKMFMPKDDASNRTKANAQKVIDNYMICYAAPDISQFRGTAWGALNAMTDMVAHSTPNRQTKSYAENNWSRIMNGHSLVDQMAEMLAR